MQHERSRTRTHTESYIRAKGLKKRFLRRERFSRNELAVCTGRFWLQNLQAFPNLRTRQLTQFAQDICFFVLFLLQNSQALPKLAQSAKDFLASKLRSVSQIWGPDNSQFAQDFFFFFFTSKLQAFPKLEDQTIPPVCTGSFCFKFTSISQTRQLIKIHKHFPNVRTISQDCWLLQNVNSACVIWWTVTLATCCRWHTDLNQVMKWF